MPIAQSIDAFGAAISCSFSFQISPQLNEYSSCHDTILMALSRGLLARCFFLTADASRDVACVDALGAILRGHESFLIFPRFLPGFLGILPTDMYTFMMHPRGRKAEVVHESSAS